MRDDCILDSFKSYKFKKSMPTNLYVVKHGNDNQYYQPYKKSGWGYCQMVSCGKQVRDYKLKDKLVELKDDETGKLNKIWLRVCLDCFNLDKREEE